MSPEQFCYWLQGLLECANPKSLDAKQTQIIKDHLGEVFKKVTPVRSPRPVVTIPADDHEEVTWFKIPKHRPNFPGSDQLIC